MSAINDRSMGTSNLLWIILVLLALVAAAAVGFFLWKHYHPAAPVAISVPEAGAVLPGLSVPGERLSVTLYVPASDALKASTATIARQPDVQLEARGAVNALLGSAVDAPAIFRDLSLRGCYFASGGTAYIDLATAGQREIRASAREELLAIYAIVNTLTQNFSEVRQVRLLIDGREAQTLAGHIDLSRSLSKRPDLVRP